DLHQGVLCRCAVAWRGANQTRLWAQATRAVTPGLARAPAAGALHDEAGGEFAALAAGFGAAVFAFGGVLYRSGGVGHALARVGVGAGEVDGCLLGHVSAPVVVVHARASAYSLAGGVSWAARRRAVAYWPAQARVFMR